MKIVLRADVDNLGNKGDLVEVAPGYARNYLVPKGMAMVASPGIERQAESMRRSRQVRNRREKEGAEATARQLAAKRIEIKARSGEGGRLFGPNEIGELKGRSGGRKPPAPPLPDPTAITFLIPGMSPFSTTPLPRTSAVMWTV